MKTWKIALTFGFVFFVLAVLVGICLLPSGCAEKAYAEVTVDTNSVSYACDGSTTEFTFLLADLLNLGDQGRPSHDSDRGRDNADGNNTLHGLGDE